PEYVERAQTDSPVRLTSWARLPFDTSAIGRKRSGELRTVCDDAGDDSHSHLPFQLKVTPDRTAPAGAKVEWATPKRKHWHHGEVAMEWLNRRDFLALGALPPLASIAQPLRPGSMFVCMHEASSDRFDFRTAMEGYAK